ncbi:MAG: hypothetical protein Q8L54_09450 [Devosia sp.]|nr:hypothetical protein [Devosia sp.]
MSIAAKLAGALLVPLPPIPVAARAEHAPASQIVSGAQDPRARR